MANGRVWYTGIAFRQGDGLRRGRYRRVARVQFARSSRVMSTSWPPSFRRWSLEDRAAATGKNSRRGFWCGGGPFAGAALPDRRSRLYEDLLGRGVDRDRRHILFWLSAASVFFTHIGYPITLWLLDFIGPGGRAGRCGAASSARFRRQSDPDTEEEILPSVSLIIAAYNEETVIEAKGEERAGARVSARSSLQVIVASDGSSDRTVEIAREAGADLVPDLPWAARSPRRMPRPKRRPGTSLAFSDANSTSGTGRARRTDRPSATSESDMFVVRSASSGPDGGYLEVLALRDVREMSRSLAGSPPETARSARSGPVPTPRPLE